MMRLFDPSAFPGDNPLAPAPAAPFGLLSLNVPGTVDPGTASLLLTSATGTLTVPAAAAVLTPGPADGDGNPTTNISYAPTASLSASGFLTGQVATLASSPYTGGGGTIQYPAVTEAGVISGVMIEGMITGTGGGDSTTLDWDAAVGPALVDIAQGTTVLGADADEYVHTLWTVTNIITGAVVTLTGNADVTAIEMAIVHAPSLEADWQPATLITRAVGDDTDGEYSVLKVGPSQALSLAVGTWRVYGRLTTTGEIIEQKAPGYLTVE